MNPSSIIQKGIFTPQKKSGLLQQSQKHDVPKEEQVVELSNFEIPKESSGANDENLLQQKEQDKLNFLHLNHCKFYLEFLIVMNTINFIKSIA